MRWNPFISAGLAFTYIGGVVLFIRFIESLRHDTPDTFIDGMAAISLFVCSAAIMAFLFFYQPLLKLFDGKPSEAVSYFLKTLGVFAAITAVALALALAG